MAICQVTANTLRKLILKVILQVSRKQMRRWDISPSKRKKNTFVVIRVAFIGVPKD